MKPVYLDNGATTPLHPAVRKAIDPYLKDQFGNPSSLYSLALSSRKAINSAREKLADLINARPEEIIFTSGGSEADNLALKGFLAASNKHGRHLITSKIEHHAILHSCQFLESRDYEVTYLPVNDQGLLHPEQLLAALREDTILVSIMMANNEIGTIQPIKELAAVAHEQGVAFHTDAVQAVGNIPVDVQELGVDLLSLSGHKFNAPKGIGALYCRQGIDIEPLIHGGSQEAKRRGGTENVAAIVGLGRAAEIASLEMDKRVKQVRRLRDRLMAGIEERIDHLILNGDPEQRLPGNCNYSFRFIEGEALLLSLNEKKIAASSGSACTSGSLEPSHVLTAIGLSHEDAHGSLRLTPGPFNELAEIDYTLEVLPQVVKRLRSMSPVYPA